MSPIANTSGCAGQREVGLDEDPPDRVRLGARGRGQRARQPGGEHARGPDDRARAHALGLHRHAVGVDVGHQVVDQRRHAEALERLRRRAWRASAGTPPARDRRPPRAAPASSTCRSPWKSRRVSRAISAICPAISTPVGPAPDDHERQQPLTLLLGLGDLGGLEGPQDLRADVQRALERLELGRVLLPFRVAEVVVLRARRRRSACRRGASPRPPRSARRRSARRGRSPVASASITRTCFSPRKIARSG